MSKYSSPASMLAEAIALGWLFAGWFYWTVIELFKANKYKPTELLIFDIILWPVELIMTIWNIFKRKTK